MALVTCPACSGLVPTSRARCVHCDQALGGRWRWLRGLMSAAAAGATTITLMACYGGPSTYDDCLDRDGDGWFPGCYDEPCDPSEDPYCDCNDGNATVHPGAPDPIGDGWDTDCSGDDGPAKCGDRSCPDAMEWPDAAVPRDAPAPTDAAPTDTAPPPDAAAQPDARPPPDAAPG